MIDFEKYSELRFTDEFNCASFVKLVSEDNGIECPIDFVSHQDKERVAEAVINKMPLFDRVDDPKDFDVVYMKDETGRRHVALYFKYNNIYHLRRDGSPVFQKITAEVKPRIIGFFRLKSRA